MARSANLERPKGGHEFGGGLVGSLWDTFAEKPHYVTTAPPGQRAAAEYLLVKLPDTYKAPFRVVFEFPGPRMDDDVFGTPENPDLTGFSRESAAFSRLLPSLLQAAPGQFVAVLGGQVVDQDRDEFALAERVERAYPDRFVLVRQVKPDTLVDFLESPEAEI